MVFEKACLSWALAKGYAVLPRSANHERIAENASAAVLHSRSHSPPPSSSPAAAPHLPVKRVRSLNKQVLWRLDALGATPQKVCWDPSAVT